MRIANLLGTATAALILALAAGTASPAFAEDELGTCHEECGEAKRICYRAARAASDVCRDECADSMAAAVSRALRACREEGLDERQCAAYVKKATEYAADECRSDCSKIRRRARHVCGEERAECREACAPGGSCVRECVDEFAGCHRELNGCTDGCVSAKRDAIAECREMIADVCDPEAYRACVREARQELRSCAVDCHEGASCGPDLRECLGTCRDGLTDAADASDE